MLNSTIRLFNTPWYHCSANPKIAYKVIIIETGNLTWNLKKKRRLGNILLCNIVNTHFVHWALPAPTLIGRELCRMFELQTDIMAYSSVKFGLVDIWIGSRIYLSPEKFSLTRYAISSPWERTRLQKTFSDHKTNQVSSYFQLTVEFHTFIS